jgi:hypothetical protein
MIGQTTKVKLVVFAPISHADIVRKTLGEAGAGKIGKKMLNDITN